MARKKRGDVHYINNRDFTEAVIRCKYSGELDPFVINCFVSLANRAVDRLYFRDPRDKEDCVQSAILDCLKVGAARNLRILRIYYLGSHV